MMRKRLAALLSLALLTHAGPPSREPPGPHESGPPDIGEAILSSFWGSGPHEPTLHCKRLGDLDLLEPHPHPEVAEPGPEVLDRNEMVHGVFSLREGLRSLLAEMGKQLAHGRGVDIPPHRAPACRLWRD